MKRQGIFGLGLGLLATLAAPAPQAEAQVVAGPIVTAPLLLSTVNVGCSNPGSSQDVAKTPVLKNTTSAAIPKGYVLNWKASDGDQGSVTLQANLAPGATVRAQGTAGNGYSCSASFNSKPDLIVKKAAWVSTSSIAVEIQNQDAWIAAGQSSVKLEVVACSGAVLQTLSLGLRSVPKAGTSALTFTATRPSGKHYLRVKADAGLQVSEKNENNNLWDAVNSCMY